jgi:hypothetical protein
MSDADFPFAFGEGAAEQFKERLKELMRAQQEAFEEVQAEQPMRVTSGAGMMPSRFDLVAQAVALATAGMAALQPQPTPEAAAEAMNFMFSRALAMVQRGMGTTS